MVLLLQSKGEGGEKANGAVTSVSQPARPEPCGAFFSTRSREDAEKDAEKNRRIKPKPEGAEGAENRDKSEGRGKVEAVVGAKSVPMSRDAAD